MIDGRQRGNALKIVYSNLIIAFNFKELILQLLIKYVDTK